MILIFGCMVAAVGLAGLWMRESMLGALLGAQFVFLGLALALFGAVPQASQTARLTDGPTLVFMVLLVQTGALVGGFALAVRQFYLRRRTRLRDLGTMKQ